MEHDILNTDVLSSLDARQLGQELAHARKKSGLTQDEAARIIEAVRTTMVAIEKGERRIRPNELVKLTRSYGRQVSDFVRPRPIVEPFRTRVQFRGPFSRTAQDDESVAPYIEEFEELCRDYLELEQITKSPLPHRYPPETPFTRAHLARTAELLAQEERNRLGLGDGPVHMIRDVLEQEVGLRVFYIKMPARFSEMYVCSDSMGGCLAINSDHPEDRRRWSIVHGYAHFLTSRYKAFVNLEGGRRFGPESDNERFADHFTVCFLMPRLGLLRRVTEIKEAAKSKFSIADVFRVAHRFGVSPQALVLRLEDLRELPSGTWEQLRSRVSIRDAQERLSLPPIPGRDDLLPVRYRQLAFRAYDDGLISESQLAHFLRAERLEARLLSRKFQTEKVDGQIGAKKAAARA